MGDIRKRWTKEEVQIIKDNYVTHSDEELVKLIPRHSLGSITDRRKRIGCNRKEINKKYHFEDFKKLAESKGYVVISPKEEYHNAGSIMKYLCPIHGEQTTTMGRLLEGKGCVLCGRTRSGLKRRRDIDEEHNKKVCKDFDYTYVSSYKSRDNLGRTIILIDFICNKHKEYGVQTTRQNNLRKGSSDVFIVIIKTYHMIIY